MSASGTFATAAAVIGVLLTIVALVASWRVTRNTQALSLYREAAQAWESKSRAQDAQIDSLKEAGTTGTSRIADLEGQVRVLRDTLTSRMAWETLNARTGEALVMATGNRAELLAMHKLLRRAFPESAALEDI